MRASHRRQAIGTARPYKMIQFVWFVLRGRAVVKLITLNETDGSVTAALPKDMLDRLRLRPGDTVFAVETEDGLLLTPVDPNFDAAMQAFDQVRRQYRDTLRKLAE